MRYKFWSNVGVDIQTAIGAATTITSIAKAASAAVGYTGTDPENAPLHKLGGEAWEKAKRRALDRIADHLRGSGQFGYDRTPSGGTKPAEPAPQPAAEEPKPAETPAQQQPIDTKATVTTPPNVPTSPGTTGTA